MDKVTKMAKVNEAMVKTIKEQLDLLDKISDDPEFLSAAIDMIIRKVETLRPAEMKQEKALSVDTTKLTDTKKWPALSPSGITSPKEPPRTVFDPEKFFINFHSGTYHWVSDWADKCFILTKEGNVSVGMRVKGGKPEISFKIGKRQLRWYPLTMIDQVVVCLDEHENEVRMKFKLLPNITLGGTVEEWE